jgi:peptidoglycan/xylan/chitin deacetylase (PgdA/CDA1 family)
VKAALAKRLVANGLHKSGLLRVYAGVRLKNASVVLTYHRVLPREQALGTWSHPAIVVTRETFERQMLALREFFRILTLDEFARHFRERRPFVKPSCLVTFDDGWLDTYVEAWPILRGLGIPATVFLPVRLVGTSRPFWQEELSSLLFRVWRAGRGAFLQPDCHRLLASLDAPALLEVDSRRIRSTIHAVVARLKGRVDTDPWEVTKAWAAVLGTETGGEPIERLMNWDQVREMNREGISFGGHGSSHRILTRLSEAEAQREVAESFRLLSEQLGVRPRAFCYPNGDYGAAVTRSVEHTGYSLAFSTIRGATTIGCDPFALPRVNVHERSGADVASFLALTTGF